jgi:hypothetical protein
MKFQLTFISFNSRKDMDLLKKWKENQRAGIAATPPPSATSTRSLLVDARITPTIEHRAKAIPSTAPPKASGLRSTQIVEEKPQPLYPPLPTTVEDDNNDDASHENDYLITALDNNDDDGGALSDESQNATFDLKTSQQLAQRIVQAEQDANKENNPNLPTQASRRPKRAFNDPQPDAEQMEWDSLPESNREPRGTKEVYDNSNVANAESSDDDSVFGPASTPPPTNRKRAKRRLEEAEKNTAPSPKKARVSRPSRPPAQTRSRERSLPQENLPSRADLYNKVNGIAKQITIQRKDTRPAQTRTRWSEKEIETLQQLIEENGISWSLIKRIDGENDGILASRDQVGLKDKARNMKFDFLK